MNGRMRGEPEPEERLAAVALTKFSCLGLCADCNQKMHMSLDYQDLAQFMQPFIRFEFLTAQVKQAEAFLLMSDVERKTAIAEMKAALILITKNIDQIAKFYE